MRCDLCGHTVQVDDYGEIKLCYWCGEVIRRYIEFRRKLVDALPERSVPV